MVKDNLTLIYISREQISFFKPGTKQFFSTPIKHGLIDDMSITDEDALALFVNEFVKSSSIELGTAVLILSKDLMFVKTYKDMIELEIDRENFITNIPFNPGELTFVEEGNPSGAYSVAANRGLCTSLKIAFEKAGFDVESVMPDDLNSTKLSANSITIVSKKDQDKLDFLRPRSKKNPKYKNVVETKKSLDLKSKLRSNLPILVGILVALVVGTAYLIITSLGNKEQVLVVEDVTQSTESSSNEIVVTEAVEESPFALEIGDAEVDSEKPKARENLNIVLIDTPQNTLDEGLTESIYEDFSELGFSQPDKTTGEPTADPVTVIEHSVLVSDDDLYALSDYLFTKFEDVRREKMSDAYVGIYDVVIKTGKILD